MGLLFSAAGLLFAGCTSPESQTQAPRIAVGGDSPLTEIFSRVAADSGVPADLLAAISWNETRFQFAHPEPDSHGIQYGLMGLTDGGPRDLSRGARLAGVSDEAARTDPEASIRAAAALLRDASVDGDFLPALRAFGGDSFARAIEAARTRGIDGRDDAGRRIVVAARRLPRTPNLATVTQGIGYAGAEWIPAYSGNYGASTRGLADVKYIVIHDTEGSYSSAVNWFKDPDANVSAHYILRSSDGHVAQMVDEKDVAWHDKCFNSQSVGIEHEGYLAKPDLWYTEAMYMASAKVTAYLADKYNIAKTHSTSTIMGHGEAPDCSDHSDPGTGWKWEHYMDLVTTGGAPQFKGEDITVDAPDAIVSGETATVTVTINNTGTAAWDLDATRIGTLDPVDRDSALFVDGDWVSPSRATAVDTRTEPATPGTFTFQIRGPEVTEPTVFDESFGFVQEDVAWFGPTFHVILQVQPPTVIEEPTGCNAGRSTSSGLAGTLLAFAAAFRRRRRRGIASRAD
jgi:hypothetical protein